MLKKTQKILENFSNNVEESVNQLKLIFKKIVKKKESLKLKIEKNLNILNTILLAIFLYIIFFTINH